MTDKIIQGSRGRLAFFLPNIFTALNLGCGFASIVFTEREQFTLAALVIVLGASFDMVDGRVARLMGTQSSFGEQFDSMSDVITFGAAPAILMHYAFLKDLGRLGGVVAFIYLLCGALRLARFNANIEKIGSDFFQGVPIPGAAMAMVGMLLLSQEWVFLSRPYVAIAYVLLYAFLMVSNIPFSSFKNSPWVKGHKKLALFILFIIIALTFSYYQYMIFIVMNVFVLTSISYFFIKKGSLGDMVQWKND